MKPSSSVACSILLHLDVPGRIVVPVNVNQKKFTFVLSNTQESCVSLYYERKSGPITKNTHTHTHISPWTRASNAKI